MQLSVGARIVRDIVREARRAARAARRSGRHEYELRCCQLLALADTMAARYYGRSLREETILAERVDG